MGEIELRQVRYFVAVAEERNVTRAAHRLAMTQPALSRAIRALERDVGAPLLMRTPQGVDLTEAGRVMLHEGRALLAAAADTAARVRGAAGGGAGVTVASPGCGAVLLDRLVTSYNDAGPPPPARAAVGTADDLRERLRSGQADIALWQGSLDDRDLHGVVLRQERAHVLLGAGHRLAGRSGISVADLADEPLVTWLGPGAAVMDPALWPGGLPGVPGPEVSDGWQMLAVVRLGQAVALAAPPEPGTQAPGGTVGVPLTDGPRVPLRLVWPRRRTTPGVRRFVRHALAEFRADRERVPAVAAQPR
ncbi:LysR family transcriptional regulator [Streptomyces marincola]|uniref:LysR family transcriptional regulator n=1 Tax=Streptomyces marincola TaxID=2878388 RepID=UPI001CF1EE5A|nr:LysR family transcriptional regulator [Streptomyces marincola]UCM89254.1 LysR family transcriptional regulator [Streptomyces marincola]